MISRAETASANRAGRISRGHRAPEQASGLAAPSGLHAIAGAGQVTLWWDPVPGAAGYLVSRAAGPDEPFRPIDHGGGDVLAVPGPPYCDPALDGDHAVHYRVAAVTGPDTVGPACAPVTARPLPAAAGILPVVRIGVGPAITRELPRPWQPMVGSEHLGQLLHGHLPLRAGLHAISAELREALRIAHDELGVRAVRAHGILCDDLAVLRTRSGRDSYDFSRVDRVYDQLMELGLRPVVELSFMPAALAEDSGTTVFAYGGVVSPPKDYDRWAGLVTAFVSHLVQRYGRDEVRANWAFEVWHEPNLKVFWPGTKQDYFRLYDVTARAVRSVDPGLAVGGPASAGAGWVGELLAHVAESGAPLDFVSTHVYGNAPLDLRPELARHGRADLPLWWTEWGMSPTYLNRVSDSVFAATFLLRGMRAALGRVDALSHWVISDHVAELGPPGELFHGGFGLLSAGNLRKPRFWALALLARMGTGELDVSVRGDGAWSLVEALAARHDDGRIGILVWNAPLDQSRAQGDPRLDRDVVLQVAAERGTSYVMTHHRIDAHHSNIVAVWERLRAGAAWPDEAQWRLLSEVNVLEEMFPPATVTPETRDLTFRFTLPMPGISYLELVPDRVSL